METGMALQLPRHLAEVRAIPCVACCPVQRMRMHHSTQEIALAFGVL
jgi:hypothetical protein